MSQRTITVGTSIAPASLDSNFGNTHDNFTELFAKNVAQDDIIALNTAKVSFDPASSTKLAGIAVGAEVNVQSDWNATSGDALILNKPAIPTAASLSVDDLITLSGVANGAVNLGTFTGSIIPDNQTVKAALQAMETALGGASGLTSLPTADNQILQATGVGTYAWSSTLEGLINDAGTSTSDVLSAAEIDDRIAAGGGLSNPMTTVGDMIKGGTSGAPARMVPGTGVVSMLETSVGAAGGPTTTVWSGTIELNTTTVSNSGVIASGASQVLATHITAANVLAASDGVDWYFVGDPVAKTGFVPSANGMLTLWPYVDGNGYVQVRITNLTASSITLNTAGNGATLKLAVRR